MSENAEFHWTEDEDLLAQYILGRLTEDAVKRLELHLKSCPRCTDRVRRERELVSGIRKYGRDELMSRLKLGLAAQSESNHALMTWQRILSAAAVLLIIAGVGIYNRWFPWQEEKIPVMKQEFTEAQRAVGEGGANRSLPKDGEVTASKQQTPSKASSDHSIAQESQGERNIEPSVQISTTRIDQSQGMKKLDKTMSAPTVGGAISMQKEARKIQNQVMTVQSGETQFWTEGESLRDQPHGLADESSGEMRLHVGQNIPKAKSTAEEHRQPSEGQLLSQHHIMLRQQSIRLLPAERRRLQREHVQSIQAYVQQSDGGATLTMYVDTLFDEDDLRSAKVEEFPPDSLIVALKSLRLGFKLPTGFLQSLTGAQGAEQK